MGKLLLLGYFGAGNLGDDGFVVDFLKRWSPQLRAHGQTCDYTAAGPRDPLEGFVEADEVRDLLGNAISRKALLTLRPGQYGALVAPGGSLLQNATSMRSLLFYLWVIWRFTSAAVPVYMLGQGLGPLKGNMANNLSALVLSNVRLIALRDKRSFDWATASLNEPGKKGVMLAGDPMLAGRLKARSHWDEQHDYVLLIPRSDAKGGLSMQQVASLQLIRSYVREHGMQCHTYALHDGEDAQLATTVHESMVLQMPMTRSLPGFVNGLLAEAQFVVSYRLHGLILAAAYGVPGLGVAYDPKVSAFCEEMGLPYCTPQDVLDGKALELVRDLWHNREQVKATMLERRAVALQRLEAAEARFAQLMWGAA